MSDYYEDLSPFDAEVEHFKDHLRTAVKQETQDELEKLRTENREMKGQLANLGKLEREAADTKRNYERKLTMAEQTARRTVEKEGLNKLLELLREPRYRVNAVRDKLPKCGKCDENRKLRYTTPRGNVAFENCECASTTQRWVAEEQLVHEVSRRSGKILAWYHSTMRYFDEDGFGSPNVLQAADGVALEDLLKNPRDYGFATVEAAQVLADALNEEPSA